MIQRQGFSNIKPNFNATSTESFALRQSQNALQQTFTNIYLTLQNNLIFKYIWLVIVQLKYQKICQSRKMLAYL